jgi:phage-related protein
MVAFPSYNIDSDSTYTREPRTLRADFGGGYSQVLGDGINPYSETWQLSFSNRPKADVAVIRAFLDTVSEITPFDWTPPDEAISKKWRVRGKYTIRNAERDARSISFTIERYFGP